MRSVLKYSIADIRTLNYTQPTIQSRTIRMLPGRILMLAIQGNDLNVWIDQLGAGSLGAKTFYVGATGQAVPDDLIHVGSVVGPKYVYHVWQKPEGN